MTLSKYKFVFFFCISIFFLCCSPITFKPTVEDTDFAKKKWTDASSEQLNAGFKLYTAKCGGCHFLPVPKDYAEKRWMEILPEMSEKCKLSHEEYDAVLKYVITKSYTQIKEN